MFNSHIGNALINNATSQFDRVKKSLDAGIKHCTAAITEKNARINDLHKEAESLEESVKQDFANIERAKRLHSRISELTA